MFLRPTPEWMSEVPLQLMRWQRDTEEGRPLVSVQRKGHHHASPKPLGPLGGGAPAGQLCSPTPDCTESPRASESRPPEVVRWSQLLNFQKICELIVKSSGTQTWPRWKYLHYRNQQTRQIGALPTWFIPRAHLPVHH